MIYALFVILGFSLLFISMSIDNNREYAKFCEMERDLYCKKPKPHLKIVK